jgi:hypothetical protein
MKKNGKHALPQHGARQTKRREADSSVTRRDFMRGTVGAALGVGVACRTAAEPRSAGGALSNVVVVRDASVMNAERAIDESVLRRMLGDLVMRATGRPTATEAWRSLVKPQDTVGLVTTGHLNPTHAELVESVRSAVSGAGVPADRVRMAQGSPEAVKPCTALISLPGLKAHWLTGIGTVFKHYIMYSGRPADYHTTDSAKLGEIWLLPHVKNKTRIIIVDALRPLCDKGPQPDPRYMWDYKGLIGGVDPVAVETVGLKIITEKRQALRGEPWPLSPPPLCVAAADEKYGLGNSRWEKIAVSRIGWDVESFLS